VNTNRSVLKLAAYLSQGRIIRDAWNIKMFVCHFFAHPGYNTHIVKEAEGYVPPIGR
jgi:hypothetical protein